MAKRNQWATGVGFILATAGSAIGLGNLWKFLYFDGVKTVASGLIVYLVFILVLGLPVMVKPKCRLVVIPKSPVSAYRSLNKSATVIGVPGFGLHFDSVLLTASSAAGF